MSNITISNKAQLGQEPSLFKSRWDTTQDGSANDTVVLPLVSNGSYNFDVDWGDGNRDNITTYNQSEVTHQYSNTGIYEIRIKGDITGWYFNNAGDDDKITEISSWGPLRFISNHNNIFNGCSNLISTATDSLTLGVSNGRIMFKNCPKLGDQGNMNSWDTSSVTDMESMFERCTGFNQPIGDWDTSSVTTMQLMFYNFYGGGTFNQDIGNWDVSSVTSFDRFMAARNPVSGPQAFNNGGSSSISGWNTSSVTNMSSMFRQCTGFNQPIGTWDTSGVTTMDYMFNTCHAFNQDIGAWDTSSCTNMHNMFGGCSVFDQDLSSWDVSGVTTMQSMFASCSAFNNGGATGIGAWDTSSVTNMESMLQRCTGFNQPIGNWDTSSVTTMKLMFEGYYGGMIFNQDIGAWDVSSVTSFERFMSAHNVVYDPQAFNNGGSSSISGWNTSSVTNMSQMFAQCTGFNQPIGTWDTSGVTNMYQMFKNADAFDQDLSNWNVTSVTNATNFMYLAAGLSTTNYDRTLSGWSSQSVQNGVSIHFGGSQYSTATGLAYRNALVSAGWTITDGGAA